ncbi:MAG: hypothetical protein COU06_02740 [Candidatus Harrisonbacteria bacterium CG10_big_fil_rev_8_21_14_0_10_38_8]|uniref:Uncharacterized protein n=1 Tax=Candidatus Harrisonbacteria bacterium CG10_big_fil_rev_8_21_14_0_10_38_8 TaxID=1974582 RepID=A0A2M6WJG8_9BACT|nr:MAG: hypothetical protein COU06_02740 [Candidatus Harrisonbacteria bacterium CG10_big_fil_rev_8_21_14_0_10_38_8]
MKKILSSGILLSLVLPKISLAHCPLCTIGAGLAAVLATSLGVKVGAVGLFIGAFAFALGIWISRILPREYIKHQEITLALLSFIATILPLIPLMDGGYYSFYISMIGEYGSLLNRTYIIDRFLLGSILGAVILWISPWLSKQITKARNNKIIPYQGISLTFAILILVALIIQFTI